MIMDTKMVFSIVVSPFIYYLSKKSLCGDFLVLVLQT